METSWLGFFPFPKTSVFYQNSTVRNGPAHSASQFRKSQKLIHTRMLIAINESMIVTPRGVDGC